MESFDKDVKLHKHDYEHVYDYGQHDFEIDLLNIYGSLFLYCTDIDVNFKKIGEIDDKYKRLLSKYKNDVIMTDEIKDLMTGIDENIKNYKMLLNREANKEKTMSDVKLGIVIGLSFGIATGAIIFMYKKYVC